MARKPHPPAPVGRSATPRPLITNLPHHLTVKRAHELPIEPPEDEWLVEELWANSGVGIIGGDPKVSKTALALDLAVSVASGLPCLRHYPVRRPGPVLVYAAEDRGAKVRRRLSVTCREAGAKLEDLAIDVIDEAALHLDLESDQVGLELAVMKHKPRLLVLDPFVRLHAHLNENSSGGVAPLLGYLRMLQRRYDMAIIVVHHNRKNSEGMREGQALRGSSDFHAWGDSNLYLKGEQKNAHRLWLTTEHRAAASQSGIELRRVVQKPDAWLVWVDPHAADAGAAREPTTCEQLLALLEAEGPLTAVALRDKSKLRYTTVQKGLAELAREKQIERQGRRWAVL